MSEELYYGNRRPPVAQDALERHQDELSVLGYTILEDVIGASDLQQWRERIDQVYAVQEAEFGGRDALSAIGEQDLCRAPLLYDLSFIAMATQEQVLALVRRVLGDFFVLNLQNAIINRPDQRHHQSAWHRDLPYQSWTSSRPLALGALFAIDTFSVETGSTVVLPHSHRRETLPSEDYIKRHAVQVAAPPGSVLLFDAMLFHRAGENRSAQVRRGVNHVYTIPLLKQQYDFPASLGEEVALNAATKRLLGYEWRVPRGALEWRRDRAARHAAADLQRKGTKG